MSFLLRKYKEEDWPEFVNLINDQWSKNHPVTNKKLFDWQYKGFGNKHKKVASMVLIDGKRMIGFRGVIPGLYQVPLPNKQMSIFPGGSLAMWVVHNDYRGKKLGLRLHLAVQKMIPVISGAGSSLDTSVPIYLKNNFRMLESMNRFVIPLLPEGYIQLLSQSARLVEITKWSDKCRISGSPNFPTNIDLKKLTSLWENVTFSVNIFSLYRNEEFWRWRYIENFGFRYLMFGDPEDSGVIIGRIEEVHSIDKPELNNLKVFRIIEIIPSQRKAWMNERDEKIENLLSGVLKWAQLKDCAAADFFCSNTRFKNILKAVGFKLQSKIQTKKVELEHHANEDILSLVPLFAPYRISAEDINVLYRICIPKYGFVTPDFEETYMVKSENDMDRPNLLEELK